MFSTTSCTTLVYPNIIVCQAAYPTHVVHVTVTHNCHLCNAVSVETLADERETRENGRKKGRTYVKPGDIQVVLKLPEISTESRRYAY
jgi:hypothetical protein